MSKLWIITGDRDVGKTRHAIIQAHGKASLYIPMVEFKQTILFNPLAKSAEILILDECYTKEHAQLIFEIWSRKYIRIIRMCQEEIVVKTPELIAIFQTENISREWLDKFRRLGAYITNIEKREVPYV